MTYAVKELNLEILSKKVNNLENAIKIENRAEGRVTVAFGISDFNRGVDMRMQDVFERADAKMYTYKRKFKE